MVKIDYNLLYLLSEKARIKFHPYLKKNYDIESKHNSKLLLAGDIGYPTDSNYWKFLESCLIISKTKFYLTSST